MRVYFLRLFYKKPYLKSRKDPAPALKVSQSSEASDKQTVATDMITAMMANTYRVLRGHRGVTTAGQREITTRR